MSSKILGLALAASSFAAVGCQGHWVTLEQYNRDVHQLKEYNDALERDNASMRAKAEAYDRLKNDSELYSAANKTYAELADSLRKALLGLGIDEKEVTIDDKGKVTFATDVLFDLGSSKLTPRGKTILSTFAKAQKGQHFRIVGHAACVERGRHLRTAPGRVGESITLRLRRRCAAEGGHEFRHEQRQPLLSPPQRGPRLAHGHGLLVHRERPARARAGPRRGTMGGLHAAGGDSWRGPLSHHCVVSLVH